MLNETFATIDGNAFTHSETDVVHSPILSKGPKDQWTIFFHFEMTGHHFPAEKCSFVRSRSGRDVLVEILIVNPNLDVSFEMFRKKHHGNIDILQFMDLE